MLIYWKRKSSSHSFFRILWVSRGSETKMFPSGILATFAVLIQKREEKRKQFCNTDLSRFLSASFCRNIFIVFVVAFSIPHCATLITQVTTTSLSVFLCDGKTDVVCARCSFTFKSQCVNRWRLSLKIIWVWNCLKSTSSFLISGNRWPGTSCCMWTHSQRFC